MILNSRSSRPDVFYKKGALRNFAKFAGKYLCQSLFFNKVADLKACNFIKKENLAQVFSCEFSKFLRTPFLTEHLWWLLLKLTSWEAVCYIKLTALVTTHAVKQCITLSFWCPNDYTKTTIYCYYILGSNIYPAMRLQYIKNCINH